MFACFLPAITPVMTWIFATSPYWDEAGEPRFNA